MRIGKLYISNKKYSGDHKKKYSTAQTILKSKLKAILRYRIRNPTEFLFSRNSFALQEKKV